MSETSPAALETFQLGKQYGGTWALRDCTLAVPQGRVTALVGPNGAGKTTLLHLAVGLLQPTTGHARVCGLDPRGQPRQVLPRVGFVAQDHPLYKGFTVREMLTLGRKLNPRWDDDLARTRLARLDIPLDRRVGKLSGGQQAQVALVLALAKRPELLLLDEPIASLDPRARRDFLRALSEAASAQGVSVVLSSHIIGDLERVGDHLIILSTGRIALVGNIAEILRTHWLLTAPRGTPAPHASGLTVVEEDRDGPRETLLVRAMSPVADPTWQAREVTLEEIVLAYLGQSSDPAVPADMDWSELEVAR
jgi:ABC-2 type transport system ATP-binding protein